MYVIIHSAKLTWQWNMVHLKMYFPFKMGISIAMWVYQRVFIHIDVYCMHIYFPTFQKSFGWGSETFRMFKGFKWSLTWPWKRLMTFVEIYKQSIRSPRTNMEPKKSDTWQTILSFWGKSGLFSGALLAVRFREGFLDGDFWSLSELHPSGPQSRRSCRIHRFCVT